MAELTATLRRVREGLARVPELHAPLPAVGARRRLLGAADRGLARAARACRSRSRRAWRAPSPPAARPMSRRAPRRRRSTAGRPGGRRTSRPPSWEAPEPLEVPEVPEGWSLVALQDVIHRAQYGLSVKADGDRQDRRGDAPHGEHPGRPDGRLRPQVRRPRGDRRAVVHGAAGGYPFQSHQQRRAGGQGRGVRPRPGGGLRLLPGAHPVRRAPGRQPLRLRLDQLALGEAVGADGAHRLRQPVEHQRLPAASGCRCRCRRWSSSGRSCGGSTSSSPSPPGSSGGWRRRRRRPSGRGGRSSPGPARRAGADRGGPRPRRAGMAAASSRPRRCSAAISTERLAAAGGMEARGVAAGGGPRADPGRHPPGLLGSGGDDPRRADPEGGRAPGLPALRQDLPRPAGDADRDRRRPPHRRSPRAIC